jgi:hypothetical protein
MNTNASIPPSVVQLTKNEDRNQSLDALTMAFCADPVLRFCYPDPKSYLTHFPRFAEAFGGKAFSCGTAFHVGNFFGSALWLRIDAPEAARRTLRLSPTLKMRESCGAPA